MKTGKWAILAAALVAVMLMPFGSADATLIGKWGNNQVEINAFSDNFSFYGWQMSDYDKGLKFTGNTNLGGKSFAFDYTGQGHEYFQVIRTRHTKRGDVTQERWAEVVRNNKGQFKIKWLRGSLGLELGRLVVKDMVQEQPSVLPHGEDVEVVDDGGDEVLVVSNHVPPPGPETPGPVQGPPPGATPVPEPATMLLLGAGLIGLAAYGRRAI